VPHEKGGSVEHAAAGQDRTITGRCGRSSPNQRTAVEEAVERLQSSVGSTELAHRLQAAFEEQEHAVLDVVGRLQAAFEEQQQAVTTAARRFQATLTGRTAEESANIPDSEED
jgi:hypothetical protein